MPKQPKPTGDYLADWLIRMDKQHGVFCSRNDGKSFHYHKRWRWFGEVVMICMWCDHCNFGRQWPTHDQGEEHG